MPSATGKGFHTLVSPPFAQAPTAHGAGSALRYTQLGCVSVARVELQPASTSCSCGPGVRLVRLIDADPTLFLEEIQALLLKLSDVRISAATLCIGLKELGLTRKRVSTAQSRPRHDALRIHVHAHVSSLDTHTGTRTLGAQAKALSQVSFSVSPLISVSLWCTSN